MFDYLSTVQRKNPVGLIEAFRQAFAPGEGPQLLIKTINAPLRPLAEEELLWRAHGRADIHIIDCSLSRGELDGLMAACDCYVSLHRAEGTGLTVASVYLGTLRSHQSRVSEALDLMLASETKQIAGRDNSIIAPQVYQNTCLLPLREKKPHHDV